MNKPLPIITLILVIFTVFCLWGTKDRTNQSETLERGEAAIGGAFTLTDQYGQTVQDIDFKGRVLLVTFGFTHCPDVCPITAATMSKALENLGPQADYAAGLFISVDPGRDTPAALKDFLANFDRHMLGLTGTSEQVKTVALAYKAYFAKTNVPWNSDTDGKEPPPPANAATDQNYVVDHSSFIYLMDKNGKYVTHFPYNANPEDIANAIKSQLS